MPKNTTISIGEMAERTGTAVSALRFYEEKGLLFPERNRSGQRRFLRADIRRVSFILIAQRFGFTIADIKAELDVLPENRTPTRRDWTRMSKHFHEALNDKIHQLEQLRDNLDTCIGCGCLSLKRCKLHNARDKAASKGAGPRYLLGDRAADIEDIST